jgi:hypothetical protein
MVFRMVALIMTDAERKEICEAASGLADALADLSPFTKELLIYHGADQDWLTDERISELRRFCLRVVEILGTQHD